MMSTLIDDLMLSDAYPECPNEVTLAQTHISNVFIGDEFVYKVKRPMNFGFLDFSTLEKREHFCNEEVRLNSRFSNDVYLGVHPVTFDGVRHRIEGDGEVVDYAVKMRRLPLDALMKSRFKEGTITPSDIERIAKAIADFHRSSTRSDKIDEFGTLKVVKFNTDENFEQTAGFVGRSIQQEQYDALRDWTDRFYKENKDLLEKRIQEKKVRDCHGDLHMEHICLTDPVIIFDCIEFNERFRYSDTASDIAFLLMDLEYNGGKALSDELFKAYLRLAGEDDLSQILTYYKVYRAYVRGKVTSFILDDKEIPDEKKLEALKVASKYFTLAHSYIQD